MNVESIPPTVGSGHRLAARGLTLGYGERVISQDLELAVPSGAFTAIVGANACGKSTLLRAFARLLEPRGGAVLLDGTQVQRFGAKAYAREVGFLPQESIAPPALTVRRLVARGRFPHQTFLSTWTAADAEAVDRAMVAAGVAQLADRTVGDLSGGQRQRVWVALVLAQETDHLLLDEPTTFLDITHQYDLLRLLATLRDEGRTVVAVLHDINQAARYADHVVAMRAGRVVASGSPAEVIDDQMMRTVFELPSVVIPDPVTGTPLVVPLER